MKKFSWRGLSIVIFICLTAYFLAPLAIPNLPEFWASQKLRLGLDLKGGTQILLAVDTKGLSEADAAKAVDQNIKIISERIDQYGVAEPIIQKVGTNRIMVQLPGVRDPEAAEQLIRQTAMLEFKLVAPPDAANQVIQILDANVAANLQQFPALQEIARKDKQLIAGADSTKADTLDTGTGVFSSLVRKGEVDLKVQYDVVDIIQTLVADTNFVKLMPMGYTLALGKSNLESKLEDRDLYVLSSEAKMNGSDLAKARVEIGSSTSTDIRTANKPYISIEMKREGARKFETVTGDNVGRRLAIVLDGVVYSAPNIQERIAGGSAQITGSFTIQEANDLAIVLNTGNLLAPIEPINRTDVGATLGKDSIESGKLAGLIGIIAVALFMLIYYKLSGLIADIALVFNVGFILAMLTAFGASLTMPGIAGIILTIGMAVDANVLIYERIKEEMAQGKTPRSAVDAGYKRATITIWDSQLTTLIAAAVLYNFGTGPIRGFAVTLAIGIVGSMFTAIVFVRSILETFVVNGTKKSLSI
ncbi:MAG: protein translocase subunit SecD [Candidatus Cloacimonetes bacterium HGW-Cloacimonetes-2]|jgi:protein-export membrane protein SecD|nr:MAG: protein translocase subunit SecD [Candidatus Cloacimonetes bacterium HGW-Cloacimonetes-2]